MDFPGPSAVRRQRFQFEVHHALVWVVAVCAYALASYSEVESGRTFRAALERAVLPTLHRGEAEMAHVARSLGIGA